VQASAEGSGRVEVESMSTGDLRLEAELAIGRYRLSLLAKEYRKAVRRHACLLAIDEGIRVCVPRWPPIDMPDGVTEMLRRRP
jgi:hypothetical protein